MCRIRYNVIFPTRHAPLRASGRALDIGHAPSRAYGRALDIGHTPGRTLDIGHAPSRASGRALDIGHTPLRAPGRALDIGHAPLRAPGRALDIRHAALRARGRALDSRHAAKSRTRHKEEQFWLGELARTRIADRRMIAIAHTINNHRIRSNCGNNLIYQPCPDVGPHFR
eukprot:gene191-biopygen5739